MKIRQLEFLVDGRPHARLAHVGCAECFLSRCRGLLGRPPPGKDEGLLIRPCSSVHTFGMRYPIDLVWLDRQGSILGLVPGLRPGRIAWRPGAHAVLELASGQIDRLALMPTMQTRWGPACER